MTRVRVPGTHWDMRLGGPQNQSGRGVEENKSHPLLGLEPPITQPVATLTTERYQILYL